MSKKRTMGNKIQKPPSEDEKQEEKQMIQEVEENFEGVPGCEEHAEEERNKEILDILGDAVVNTKEDGYRLTWQAFYCLKQQEMQINRRMLTEIDKIKDKYQLLKQNIYTKISNTILGKQVSEAHINNQDVSKISKSIPDFWIIVFTKAGIISSDIDCDLDCLRKLESFTCDFLEQSFNYVKIRFTFKQQPMYFSNKQLQICIEMGDEDEPTSYTVNKPIAYKLPKNQSSFFTQLFDNPNVNELSCLTTEIKQSYRNALYFYFSKFHSACNASQVDDESNYLQSSVKKIKSEPSSAEKVQTPQKIAQSLQ